MNKVSAIDDAIAVLRSVIGDTIIYIEMSSGHVVIGAERARIQIKSWWQFEQQSGEVKDASCHYRERTHWDLWRLIGHKIMSVELNNAQIIVISLSENTCLRLKGIDLKDRSLTVDYL